MNYDAQQEAAKKLNSCPFCNGTPEMQFKGNEHTKKRSITVRCPDCRVERTDSAVYHDHEWLAKTAIRNWNQRRDQDNDRV